MRTLPLASLLLLACAVALAGEETLHNTDMYVSPAAGETPSTGKFLIFHEGEGKPGEGYFKKHEPGEIAEFHLFVPDGTKEDESYPLLIVYHGGKDGGSGKGLCRNLSKVSTREHPVFVLSPNMYTLDAMKEVVAGEKYPIDPRRVAVFGFSSGGMGVRAAMVKFVKTQGGFTPALLISASTTATIGRAAYPQVPYVVIAGEKETAEFAKHPLLQKRRSDCRRHSLLMQQVIREVRYIEMKAHGHSSGKADHHAVLQNLLRALPTPGIRIPVRKPLPELTALLDAAGTGDWGTVKAEMTRLGAVEDGRTKRVYTALRRKLLDAVAKQVKAQVKAIGAIGPDATTLEVTRSLALYDRLGDIVEAFADTPKGETLNSTVAWLDRSEHWQKELEARRRYHEAVAERPSEGLKEKLRAILKDLPDTEYGGRRVREKLLALEM